jgi:hypothetical protein
VALDPSKENLSGVNTVIRQVLSMPLNPVPASLTICPDLYPCPTAVITTGLPDATALTERGAVVPSGWHMNNAIPGASFPQASEFVEQLLEKLTIDKRTPLIASVKKRAM